MEGGLRNFRSPRLAPNLDAYGMSRCGEVRFIAYITEADTLV